MSRRGKGSEKEDWEGRGMEERNRLMMTRMVWVVALSIYLSYVVAA